MANWKSFLDPEARGGRFLPWKEVARATGLSRTTAWRLQKRDEFPAPYAISPGRVGYREDEVEAWKASRDHGATGCRRGRPPSRTAASDARIGRPSQDAVEDQGRPLEARRTETECVPASPSPPLPPGPPLPGRQPGRARRRTQHAKAIALQMRFDF